MKKSTIRAVETIRRIRDAQYEQLRDKTVEERIAFYRAKARQMQTLVAAEPDEQKTAEPQVACQGKPLSLER